MLRGLVRVLGLCAVTLALAAPAAAAETGSPWWHLTSVSRPTYIQPGTAQRQIWRLTVHASSGEYRAYLAPWAIVELTVGESPAEVGAEIEGDLRHEHYFPPGKLIEVTSPCGKQANTACPKTLNKYEVYEIELAGELTYRHFGTLFTCCQGSYTELRVSGGPATVEVSEVSQGRPDGEIVVRAVNLGDGYASPADQPITLKDVLPPGLEAVGIEGGVDEGGLSTDGTLRRPIECSLQERSCTFYPDRRVQPETYPEGIPQSVYPYGQLQMEIMVRDTGAETGAVNQASVSGGGAPGVNVRQPLVISDAQVPFGASLYEMTPEEVGGQPTTQAGQHPFQLTTTIVPNTATPEGTSAGASKDLRFKLPPGLVGNPSPFPRCPLEQFLSNKSCPANTVVGVSRSAVKVAVNGITSTGTSIELIFDEPIYNLEPAAGEPARFGFIVSNEPVLLDTSVRTGGDYGIMVTVKNITQTAEFLGSEAIFWGVPGDERHNISRGTECLHVSEYVAINELSNSLGSCPAFSESKPPPLLAMPTSCTGPLRTSVEGDSWFEPGERAQEFLAPLESTVAMPALDGCNRPQFEPSIRVSPDGTQASTPTGLTVDVHVNQASILSGSGIAESNVRDITVALPQGVAIDPAGGDGLEACSSDPGALGSGVLGSPGDQVGFKGFGESPLEPGVDGPLFTAYLPESIGALENGFSEPLRLGSNFCSDASKIAEATIRTPLLPKPLTGFVYLAAQEANPFGSVVAMYLVAEDKEAGTLVKLPGQVGLCKGVGEVLFGMSCQGVGQIVASFENEPQLPFEDAELHFFGGERAPLASPAQCGTYETRASFVPWSGGAPVQSSSSFQITSGPKTAAYPGGSPCPGQSLPFSPSLTAGTTNVNAGSFTPFSMTMSRESGQQNLQSVSLTLPPGLSGLLSGVELCPEPQADQGACGPNSLIGETTVGVGVGGEPFSVKGGRVYITGPFNGTGACTVGEAGCAPFGLSIVNPAKAGPYDLADTKDNHPACDCVLVRAKIEVNPFTAALTITSDNGGPYKIPTSIEGIPLQIQHVNVTITRKDFQFNPTSCDSMEIGGELFAAEGAARSLSVPFQAANCATLKFEPTVSASVSGKVTKADGTSFRLTVGKPTAQGEQADLRKFKIELPVQLPSRLTTLQKACTSTQFEANPAGCPTASVIGFMKTHTPLLPVPVEGPMYFVSHGGEAWPSLEIVLQGYGVKVVLVGQTHISESGITSSTFNAIPDVPFSSAEVELHNGPYSALTGLGNLCAPTTTTTVKKKVTVKVKVHGHVRKKTVTKKVKQTKATSLLMPTEMVAQNDATVYTTTHVSVTECPKSTAKVTHKKAKKKGKKAKRKSRKRT